MVTSARPRHPGPSVPVEVDQISQAWRQHPQARGLYAWWPTVGGAGKKLREMVSGFDATGYSDTAVQPDPVTGIAAGEFVGNSDSDRRYDAAMPWTGGPISISFWNYAPSVPPSGQNTIPFGFRNVQADTVPTIEANTPYADNTLYWYYGPSFAYETTTDYSAYYGKWMHICLDSDATTSGLNRIWLNGQLVASSSSSSTSPGTTDTFSIGGKWRGTTWHSHWGRLADMRVYSRTLAGVEVQNLYAPKTRWSLLPVRTSRRYFIPSTPTSSTIRQRRLAQILRVGSRSAIAC